MTYLKYKYVAYLRYAHVTYLRYTHMTYLRYTHVTYLRYTPRKLKLKHRIVVATIVLLCDYDI